MAIRVTNLDRLFSQYIRARAGWRCECCGVDLSLEPHRLDTSHVLSRRHVHTRWDEANAVAECKSCHRYHTEHPHDFADWTRGYLGSDHVAALQERAKCTDTLTQKEREEIADELFRKVQQLGETPVCTGKKRAKKAAKKRSVSKRGAINGSGRKREQYKRKVNGQTVKRETET